MKIRIKLQHGFTLIEAIITIVIVGIVSGIVGMFIRIPIQQYTDIAARVELTDNADTALRRIGRDLRRALPNSVRVSSDNATIEFLQTSTGGRYRYQGSGNILDTTAATSSFDVLGVMNPVPVAGNQVVVYNLGISGADAYSGENRAEIASFNSATNTINLTAATQFPLESPSHRFQVVDTPVTYRYDSTAQTLTRYWGYTIVAAQPTIPTGGQSALIAQNVTACSFTYDQLVINERSGLVSMQVTLAKNNETVTLYHEVHVSNVP